MLIKDSSVLSTVASYSVTQTSLTNSETKGALQKLLESVATDSVFSSFIDKDLTLSTKLRSNTAFLIC